MIMRAVSRLAVTNTEFITLGKVHRHNSDHQDDCGSHDDRVIRGKDRVHAKEAASPACLIEGRSPRNRGALTMTL